MCCTFITEWLSVCWLVQGINQTRFCRALHASSGPEAARAIITSVVPAPVRTGSMQPCRWHFSLPTSVSAGCTHPECMGVLQAPASLQASVVFKRSLVSPSSP